MNSNVEDSRSSQAQFSLQLVNTDFHPGERLNNHQQVNKRATPDLRNETRIAPVVWALDAFPDDLELQLKTAQAIQMAFPETPIHPVYILSEETFFERGYSSYLKPALKPMAFKAALRILAETQLTQLRKPRILIERSSSRDACARRLLRYAQKLNAGSIAVGSHARRGLNRFFTGNFCDELIDTGNIPILIAGPRTLERKGESESTERTIVFPTDFSPACREAFENVLQMASVTKAVVHLFHRESHGVDPYSQMGMATFASGWVSMESISDDSYRAESDDYRKDFEQWKKRADEMNVAIQFVADNFREPASEAIVEYVRNLKEGSVLLAMVSQPGQISENFLGSVTRDVIRTSPCPIYVAPRAF